MPTSDPSLSTARAYDGIVDVFDHRTRTITPDLDELRQAFVAAVGARAVVLDAGCGPGRDATHFKARGLTVVGLDASTGMAGRTRRDGVPTLDADLRAAPVRPRSLDGLWSAASLLHVPARDTSDTIRSWAALLRPGGHLGLSTSLGTGEGWESGAYPSPGRDDDGIRRWFTHRSPDELGALLESAGFDVLQRRERTSNRRWLQLLAKRRTTAG